VPAVLDIVGDRWTLAIVDALLGGPRRFDELVTELGIPRSTLSVRLRRLATSGCVEREAYQERPTRYGYHLSPQGADLADILIAVRAWNAHWRGGAPPRHAACPGRGGDLSPGVLTLICGHCSVPVVASDVRFVDGPGRATPRRMAARRTRVDQPLSRDASAAAILEDRWAAVVLAAAFFGVRRFADLQVATEMAPNILTARLRALEAAGLMARRRYQDRPPRDEYVLASAGLDLFPVVVGLVRWGDRWLRPGGGASVELTHRPCQQPLQPVIACGRCGAAGTAVRSRVSGVGNGATRS